MPTTAPDEDSYTRQVVRLHRSWRSLLPYLLLAAILTPLASMLASNLSGPAGPILHFGSREVSLPVSLLIALVCLVRPLMLLLDCRHVISGHHLESEHGRMSAKREVVRIPFEDLKGVRVRQSVFERMVGVGTILAWTSISDHPDVVMKGIARPHRYAAVLSERIDNALLSSKARAEKVS